MADFTLTYAHGKTLDKPLPNVDIVGDGLIGEIAREHSMIDTTSLRSANVGRQGVWTVREKHDGVWVPVKRKKNVLTTYGLTALASAIGGGYNPPYYIVYDATLATVSALVNAGDTSVQLSSNPTATGDTGLVLSAGLAAQETVSFSSVTGTGPFVFSLTAPTVYSHPVSDPCTRACGVNDTMAVILNEQQYDSVNAPLQRLQATAGYTTGTGNYILQFYFLGIQAVNQWFMNVGSSDTSTTSAGNLHTIYTLGYYHDCSVTAVDVEVDVSITIANA